MTKDQNNELEKRLQKVIRIVDECERFDLENVLELFKDLNKPDLRDANSQLNSKFLERVTIRNREARRFTALANSLFSLTLDKFHQ